ncbi:zinc knuckle domain protein [Penicillium riverlandense]|uniref:zinc knuckle domain protein n=1 Tax=Penicillium riverlandense TaxID=1903569 RepID=UPI00254972DF|nr:zinc knuckle domain protein [Penicillium riverlandense]KAJ5820578.1 zinc knuckle domain protein [Penicillium riverlandense]
MEEKDLQERSFRIEDIARLKKRDKMLETFASMGTWFDSTEAEEWMLDNGLLIPQRYIGRVERCEIKKKRALPMPTIRPSGMVVQGSSTLRPLWRPA